MTVLLSPPSGSTRRRIGRLYLPSLAPLLVLVLLALVSLTGSATAAPAPYRPRCVIDTIPAEAYAVEEFARTHNYSPPPGLKGNSPFDDSLQDLPPVWRPYKEYDVFPRIAGVGRRPERVVLTDRYDGASWYTPDHYGTWYIMWPGGCRTDPNRPSRTQRHAGPQPQLPKYPGR